jgi:hypothetical protein
MMILPQLGQQKSLSPLPNTHGFKLGQYPTFREFQRSLS